jgi:hypothetical protein
LMSLSKWAKHPKAAKCRPFILKRPLHGNAYVVK